MSEKENSVEGPSTVQNQMNQFATAVGLDIRNLNQFVANEAKTVHEKLEAQNVAFAAEIRRLHKKLHLIIALGALGWFALIIAQAAVFGNQNQTYQHITSMTEVTSKVAENAVNDTAVANAALTATVCAPVNALIQNAEGKLK